MPASSWDTPLATHALAKLEAGTFPPSAVLLTLMKGELQHWECPQLCSAFQEALSQARAMVFLPGNLSQRKRSPLAQVSLAFLPQAGLL